MPCCKLLWPQSSTLWACGGCCGLRSDHKVSHGLLWAQSDSWSVVGCALTTKWVMICYLNGYTMHRTLSNNSQFHLWRIHPGHLHLQTHVQPTCTITCTHHTRYPYAQTCSWCKRAAKHMEDAHTCSHTRNAPTKHAHTNTHTHARTHTHAHAVTHVMQSLTHVMLSHT